MKEEKLEILAEAIRNEGIVGFGEAEWLAGHIATTVHEEKTLVEYVQRMYKEEDRILEERQTWQDAARTWFEDDMEYYYFESDLGVVSVARRCGSVHISASTHIGSV